MKKILLVCCLVLLITITASCKPQEVLDVRIDKAIEKSFKYLNDIRNEDYSYDDGYLLYIYGTEDLECPEKDCNITYRILDAFFNLGFIKQEVDDYSIIQDQVDDADRIMNGLVPLWEKGRIYNIQNEEMRDNNGFALDTYCILGYIYKSEKMAETAKESLQGLEWEPEDFYFGYNEFRHIADEAWCTRLLIATDTDFELSKKLLEKHIEETDELLALEDRTLLVPKINAIYHVLFLIEELGDDGFEDTRVRYHEFLVGSIGDLRIKSDTLTYSNILDILAYTGYQNDDVLRSLAELLLERQEIKGQWYMSQTEKKNYGQVFSTFRAILALNKYRNTLD